MNRVLYDGSLAGLLSVLFEVFSLDLQVDRLERADSFQPDMFGRPVQVTTSRPHAERVWSALERMQGFDQELVLRCWLFGTVQSQTDILHLLIRLFREGIDGARDFRDEAILRCNQVNQKMGREIHRMHAFVRFAEAEDGLFFSEVQPDFDVLPLAVTHFEDRYQDQEWLIWDQLRGYGFWFIPGQAKSVRVDQDMFSRQLNPADAQTLAEAVPASYKSVREDGFQQLWASYFQSVNIEARNNPRLHLRHVPKRYWANLTEKRQPINALQGDV